DSGINSIRQLAAADTTVTPHQQAIEGPFVSLMTFGVIDNRRCSQVRTGVLVAHWVRLTGHAPAAIENVYYPITGGGGRAIGVLKGQHEVVGVIGEFRKPIAHVRRLAEISIC